MNSNFGKWKLIANLWEPRIMLELHFMDWVRNESFNTQFYDIRDVPTDISKEEYTFLNLFRISKNRKGASTMKMEWQKCVIKFIPKKWGQDSTIRFLYLLYSFSAIVDSDKQFGPHCKKTTEEISSRITSGNRPFWLGWKPIFFLNTHRKYDLSLSLNTRREKKTIILFHQLSTW